MATLTSPPLLPSKSLPWALAISLALLVVLVPLWSTDIPPMLDYPNHLARQYILFNLPDSPHLQTWYAANWSASPYLAMDLFIQALARILPVEIAGKLFLTVTLLLCALAPIALNWAHYGRITPISLFGLLFVHNQTVTMGFINYLFAMGFALCLFALWIRLRSRGSTIKWLLLPALATLLFFSHLFGYMVYGIVLGAYELGRHVRAVRERRSASLFILDAEQRGIAVSLLLQFLIPMAIFALYGPSTEISSSNTYGGLIRKLDIIIGASAYLMPAYIWSIDSTLTALLPVATIALVLSGKLEIEPDLRWPLVALVFTLLAMPMELFSSYGADHRILPALGFLFVGSLRLRTNDRRANFLAISLIIVLLIARTGAVTTEWRKSNNEYSEYIRAFDSLREGKKMYFAFGHAGGKQIGRLPTYHLPLLAVMHKDVYVPFLFANGMFTISYTRESMTLQGLSDGQDLLYHSSPNWDAIVGRYDFFYLVNEQHFDRPPPSNLVQIFKGEKVTVYRNPD